MIYTTRGSSATGDRDFILSFFGEQCLWLCFTVFRSYNVPGLGMVFICCVLLPVV